MPFATIIGHTRLVGLLRHAVLRGRVPQSLLFAGPEGVGKHAVALALAQAVNCPKRTDGDGCGKCPTCLRIARGQHSDVTWLDTGGEASIKIKALRERVLENVGYRPFEASRRVYVIDPADELTWEAQDALLKTLEEPPPAALLILITSLPDTLFPTVRSRCRRLRFGALTETEVARVLVEHARMDATEARVAAAASGGSVGRALSELRGDLEDDREAAFGVVRAAGGRGVLPRLKAGAALAQHGSKRRDRDALSSRLSLVQALLRDLVLLSSNGRAPLANGDLETGLRALLPAFPTPRLSSAYAAVTQAQQDLDRNASPKIIADWVAVTL